jgi:hypothetical protein
MAQQSALLSTLFQTVTKTLAENQQSLNQADEYNHDHGTNMVQTFRTISNAIQKKKGSSDGDALAYAAAQLAKSSTSGSGKLYSQGLSRAATQFQGQQINPQMGMSLLQTLLGGQQSQQQTTQSAGGDMLGALLGGLGGGQTAQSQVQQPESSGGDLLGSLLGGLTGTSGTDENKDTGLDIGDLLSGGMAYMQAKQSGASNAEAILKAIVAGSGMGNATHRTQSTQLVADTFMKVLGSLGNQ